MNTVRSGLLPALIDYYERLESDPEQSVEPFGFSRAKIHACVVLERDGSLSDAGVADIRDQNDKGKPIPRLLVVPDGGGRSGTAIKPFFCWDNTGYALGRDNKGKHDRAERMFEAFRDLHLEMKKEVGEDEGYAALCRFLEQWNPADAESLPRWEEIAGSNVVFQIRGVEGYIHQSEAVKKAWATRINNSDSGARGFSLVTGEEDELARLHPLISGVAGANTTGAAIVSFNLNAFTSYGKEQSYNAPVGVRDTFRYTTALNRLLSESTRRVRIGDATVVFWSDRKTAAEEWFAHILDESAEDQSTVNRVREFFLAAKQGRLTDTIDDPDAPFYVLGLSPNASRLNVRFWLAATVGSFADHISRHIQDVEIVTDSSTPLTIRRLLRETARETKDISPVVASKFASAVLTGKSYPHALLDATLRRIRTDALVNSARAAILKACLLRNYHKEITMALNPEDPSLAYQCGRLLAILEYAQKHAVGNVNAGVVRKFYGAASTTPGVIFGRLLDTFTKAHLPSPRLPQALRQSIERDAQQILSMLTPKIPRLLLPAEQATFAVGYYHQKAELPDKPTEAWRKQYRYSTERGELVRSKSEVIIANMLHHRGVDYVYEKPFACPPGRPLYPDFTISRETQKDTVIIEHLGMIDTESYRDSWQSKIARYRNAGVLKTGGPMGTLVTFEETAEKGLDTARVRAKLDELFGTDDTTTDSGADS